MEAYLRSEVLECAAMRDSSYHSVGELAVLRGRFVCSYVHLILEGHAGWSISPQT